MHVMGVCLLGDGLGGKQTKMKISLGNMGGNVQTRTLGGLGIMNTKLMYICLMAEWLWKLYAGGAGALSQNS
jgi:hypothetical protein